MFWTLEISLLLGAIGVNLSRVSMLSAPSTNCLNWMSANHYCDWQCNSVEFEFDGGDCTDPPKICPAKWIGDSVCQPLCDTVALLRDGGDCGDKSGCLERMLGNGYCDRQCNDEFHNFDAGDCLVPVRVCDSKLLGNRYCDEVCNDEAHNWDDGDCAEDPSICKVEWLGDGQCDLPCNNEFWFFDAGDCAEITVCQKWMLGNGYCDWQCQDEDNEYDHGDCPIPPPSTCLKAMVGNGYCDEVCNDEVFDYDDGDCEKTACLSSMLGDGVCQQQCNTEKHGFDSGDCDVGKRTCIDFMLGNGYCDWQCNDAAHQWDGHDCCPPQPDECLDQMAGNGYCDEPCNNEQYDWDAGECKYPPESCLIKNIGNNKCNEECNNEKWFWDGGDCDTGKKPACQGWMLGNGYCDPQCESEQFNWDDHDCPIPKHDTCLKSMIGNSYCDKECNTAEFEFDGGDCTSPPEKCLAKMLGDGKCDEICDTVEWKHDNGDCSRSCLSWMLDNKYCDWQCNTEEYDFDNGACNTVPVPDKKCEPWMRGNGYCDEPCDTLSYDWDGGDCEDDPVVCQAKLLGNGVCDEVCNTEEWEWDGGECRKKTGCLPFMLGNHYCDPQCNIAAFNFDNGDCKSDECEETKCDEGFERFEGKCVKICRVELIGNGICESWCNRVDSAFDGGDCTGCNDRKSGTPCVRFCESAYLNDGYCDELCNVEVFGFDGGDCKLKCDSKTIGDGHCDTECNNEDNDFDGGDCVVCDHGFTNVAGICIKICADVAGNGVCDDDCNTAETLFDGGDCVVTCHESSIGDGVCDKVCDDAANRFDGGDCVICDPGYKQIGLDCMKECDVDTIGDNVCNPECNNSSGDFDNGDCLVCKDGYKRVGFECVAILTCEVGWEVVGDHCEKVCIKDTIGDGVCNVECNTADHSMDGGDCVKCDEGFVNVSGKCIDYCKAQTKPTGKCDKNCADYTDLTCKACANGYDLKEGFCIRLLWVSEPFTLVGDGEVEHGTVVVPGQGGWQIVPGTEWIWDTNINKVGTYKFTDKIWFEDWLKPRISTVSLTVSVDDYYRILVNGKVVVEKAGVWNQAPITYDITPQILINATPENPNILEIHATNGGGPGGLSYKVLVHQKCPAGADDVDGNCVCKRGTTVNGDCLQTIWVSTPKTMVGEGAGAYPAVEVAGQGGWQPIPGTTWIWDTNINKVGTFTFVENIWLSDWLKSRVASVSITLSVDDYYKLIFNDNTITEKSGVWNAAPITFDLTSSFRADATASNPNVLKVLATNGGGPGGLQYKLVVNLKCDNGMKSADGNCVCASGASSINGSCASTIWVSGTNTLVGGAYPATLVPGQGGWQPIPGTAWIWDSDINKVGTFKFSEDIIVPESLKSKITSASITLSVDDYYKLVFNGNTITEKSGVWNAAPITFDLTSSFNGAITNKLEIYATNGGGPGGLQYKLTLNQQCQDGAASVDGVCTCKTGFAQNGDKCAQSTWVSRVKTEAGISTRPCVGIDPHASWKPVADAKWIWDTDKSKVGVITFPIDVPLTNWHKDNISKATLEISVDDFYRIVFNGKEVTPKAGVWDQNPITYDLTKYLQFPDGGASPKINPLFIQPTNTGGPGGIDYKLKLHIKCKAGAADVNGVCVCKAGFLDWNGECIQTSWTSGTADGQVGDGEIEHTNVVVPGQGGWQIVPGTEWVWDTNINKVGTYKFYDDIVFDDWLKPKITTVSLTVSVDDYYRIVVNDQVVVQKAGVWNAAPISYDITPYIRINATPENPNVLEIHATNGGGPGGLSYKVVAHQNCPAGTEEVDGNCVCKLGMNKNGECMQTIWVSTTKTMVGEGAGAYPAVAVSQVGGWQPIPGTTWIWDTNTNKVGTFTFVENIWLSDWLKSRVGSVSITLSVDDYYKVVLNGNTITEKSGAWNAAPISFDLTASFHADATASNPNVLKILATNGGGPGGLQYKVVVNQKCDNGLKNVDGNCVCGNGTSLFNGECLQTVWVSGTNSYVANAYPATLVTGQGGWQPIPGAAWVWDSNINKVGTFEFSENITVPVPLRPNIASASITLSVDDYYKLVFNAKTITEKSGVWNAAPITFDLTPIFDSGITNRLDIYATNGGGPGGLQYKLTLKLKCQEGASDVDGVCVCKNGFAEVGAKCIQTAWISGPLTKVDISLRPWVVITPHPEWKPVDGHWIWDTDKSKVGVITFPIELDLTDWHRDNIDKVTVAVSCDDFYRIKFNGAEIVAKGGIWNGEPITYDVTKYLEFPNGGASPLVNLLQLQTTNTGGPGGVDYKVNMYKKCKPGATDVNGSCVCKAGFSDWEGSCVQTAWVSQEGVLVGDGEIEHTNVVVPGQGGWQIVPGTEWVWDTNINKVGTYKFTENIVFDDWLKSRISTVSLTVSVDDYYKVVCNDKVVVEKAGVWNAAPISYDLTPFINNDATADKPNVLDIHATNGGGPGGLSYKVVVHQKCSAGSEDVDGDCVCKLGSKINGECMQTIWVSTPKTMVGEGSGAYPAVAVPGQGGWQPIDGATWIWDTNINKVGTFTFVENIWLSDSLKSKVGSASITLSVDDYYKLIFNDKTITEKSGVWNAAPITFDLTSSFRADATASNPNVLKVLATNGGGPGGLQYKLVVNLKCDNGLKSADGKCVCASGSSLVNGECLQTVWVSGTNTYVASAYPATLVPGQGGWQPIPGAAWVWDSNINKVGTFVFSENITVPVPIRANIIGASITLSVDDYYKLVFNAKTITEKSGVWNAAPITFDLTPNFDSGITNRLDIYATNGGGPGGLQYKLTIKQKCQAGASDVDGVCKCVSGFAEVGTKCIQTAWISGPKTHADISTRQIVVISPEGGWQPVPDAKWIWDTTKSKVAVVTFLDSFILTELQSRFMNKATLTVSVDDFYRIWFNGNIVTEKAGVWNAAPITYDLSSLMHMQAGVPNELKIQATNSGGPGGLAYKFQVNLGKCRAGAEEVNGVCQCKGSFTLLNDYCYQSVWVSTPNSLSANVTPLNADLKTRVVKTVPIAGGWQSIPGATWVWDTTAGQGTFAFVEYISIPTVLKGHVSGGKVTVSVDENYKLIFNNQVVTPKAGDWFLAPIVYDVTQYLIYDDTKPNILRFDTTNLSGPGGLAYKFELTITKCGAGQDEIGGVCVDRKKCNTGMAEVNGVCQCKTNYVPFGDSCYQTLWVSTPNSLSANVTPLNADLKTRVVTTVPIAGGWQSIPGATWVWDTTSGQGTFAFVEYISIPTVLKGHVAGGKVTVSVDENYKLIFNDQVVTPKAGDWFLAPIVYDVTQYLIYDDTKPNILRFDTTNLSGPGGLAYKFELTITKCEAGQDEIGGVCVDKKKCNTGMAEVNGVCQCKTNFVPFGDSCYQTLWVSTPNSLSANVTPLNADLKTRVVKTVPIAGGWQSIPGATWVWDTTSGQGTFAFVEYISIPTVLKGHVAGGKVTVSVDENYKLIFNDQVVTPKAGDWFLAPIVYDVTQYLLYDDSKPNILRFDTTNLSGPGGLAYKFELTITKCAAGQDESGGVCVDKKKCNTGMAEVNGVCQCKTNYVPFGDACYQTLWVSTPNSLSANVTPLNADLKTRVVKTVPIAGGWQSIPGATWVWDTTSGQGTFAFVEYISIPTALKGHVSGGKVTVSVDENYKLIFNDKVVTPKAGDWFLAPIVYDVTQYLLYDDSKPNILRFDTTNLSGPGGLAYKFELTITKCGPGQEEVAGVCKCKVGFQANGSGCYQTVWVSTANSLSANVANPSTSLQTRTVKTVSIAGGWQSVPGATWIWDTTSGQGTFAFVEYVSIPAALQNHIATAKVTVSVDEKYKLLMNDQVITPSAGDWWAAPITYDVTQYLKYDDANKNILRFDTTNLSGPGGLAYKLELTLK